MNNRLVDFLVRFKNRRSTRSNCKQGLASGGSLLEKDEWLQFGYSKSGVPLRVKRNITGTVTKSKVPVVDSEEGSFELTILSSKFVLKLLNKLVMLKLLRFKVMREDGKYSYLSFKRNFISKLELISSPSRPVYKGHAELLNDPKLKKGGAFYILSNSEFGLLSSLEALEKKVGGKLILLVN